MQIKTHITILIFTVTLAALFPSCNGGENVKSTIYMNMATKSASSGDTTVGKNSFGEGVTTYEIYFRLSKQTDCIKITITSKTRLHEFTDKETVKKTYFIVDKQVDVSDFNSKTKFIFTELGKNFNKNWKNSRSLVLCSDPNSPINILDNKSVYRIRFTVFDEQEFTYSLTIHSNVQIAIFDNM